MSLVAHVSPTTSSPSGLEALNYLQQFLKQTVGFFKYQAWEKYAFQVPASIPIQRTFRGFTAPYPAALAVYLQTGVR